MNSERLPIACALEDTFNYTPDNLGYSLQAVIEKTSLIKAIFNEECAEVVADKKLAKQINDYVQRFLHKNEDHVAFFGGNLTGVHVVRFTDADNNRLFDEILEVDEYTMQQKLNMHPAIDPEWKRVSSIYNVTMLWLLHLFTQTTKLSAKEKRQTQIMILVMLQAKFLTSYLYIAYQYPADPDIAQAAVEQLSRKFILKQAGNWYNLLVMRSEYIIDNKYPNMLKQFNDDAEIIAAIPDIQQGIKSVAKSVTTVFYNMHAADMRVISTSNIVEIEGETQIRSIVRRVSEYKRYIQNLSYDAKDLIKDDLVKVILDLMPTLSERFFRETLLFIAESRGSTQHEKLLNSFIDDVIVHAFEVIDRDRALLAKRDFANILIRLRGVYMSARSTDPLLMQLREEGEKIVKRGSHATSPGTIAATRTGVMLYLVTRALAMNHYR